MPDGSVAEGTARSIGTDAPRGYFETGRDDVKDLFMWVTLTSGFDVAWKLSELATQYERGEFGKDR
jgi:hypothetical protein